MNFVMTWALVRREHGKLWLRVDDADEARSRDVYTAAIKDTLHWLGFDWDHETPPQKERRALYQKWLAQLPHYACDCSRKVLQERTGGTRYDGHCRERGLPHVPGRTQLRFLSAGTVDDVVLWRKEDLPAYQLVSLSEDLDAGVNFVVRGADLLDSTRAQQLLAEALGPDGEGFTRATFVHHPLLLDPTGQKLAKSRGAHSLQDLRTSGASVAQVYALLCQATGWQLEARCLGDFLRYDFSGK